MNPPADQHREARFLAQIARTRPADADIAAARETAAGGLDPLRLLPLVDQNRLAPLLYRNLKAAGLDAVLPPGTMSALQQRLLQEMLRGARLEQETRNLLERFQARGLRVILLRGLAVGEAVYGDGSLRPYSDLDLLLLKEDLPAAKEQLREAGYGAPAKALEDGYYERQHLHLLYVHRKTGVMAEIHWALDHRFTPWLVDYAELFRDARPGTIAGAPALALSPEDMLLSLGLHLVKHGPCAELLLDRPAAAERILAAGWWIHVLDVAEAVERGRETLDWARVADKARRWNIGAAVRASLRCAGQLLRAPMPAGLIESLGAPRASGLARRLQEWQLRALAPDAAKPSGRLAGFRHDIAFRPVRLLDALLYLWPDEAYLARRYPERSPFTRRGRHLAGGIGELARGFADLLVSQWRRRAAG
ncbi:MAG TPA: nucleotidyltransferase family protein [Kiritimatiellia bacterium]|nr:nucleotidyltransferase family protein [Kiritimatiellia bacterium]HRZ12415.1 nucleotidyltransferase family protein [Kiritimatiellia bacterium]HSA17827.1 nucleotidyltransferase family protein [Kiritimatiellia bacterium]